MPGLFEALGKMPKTQNKRFYVDVDGVQHEVSLEKKKWAQQHGEDNLMIKDGELVLRPKPQPKTQYSVLGKADRGYVFQDNDIHWPTQVVDGGSAWLIEQE